MAGKRCTSIEFSTKIRVMLTDLSESTCWSQKHIISAGILAFGKLSLEEKHKCILAAKDDTVVSGDFAAANEKSDMGPFFMAIGEMLEKESKDPRLLSISEQESLDKFRGMDKPRKKRKAESS